MCDGHSDIPVVINGEARGIDKCLVPLVVLLNGGGFSTIASCCGHGHRPGNIALSDGRELHIARNFDEGRRIDALFPVSAYGEPVRVYTTVSGQPEPCPTCEGTGNTAKHRYHVAPGWDDQARPPIPRCSDCGGTGQ